MQGSTLQGETSNLTIYNTSQTGQIEPMVDDFTSSSNVNIDNNSWTNTSQCGSGGRIYIDWNNTNPHTPIGTTISNNYFDGGCTEDILLSGGVWNDNHRQRLLRRGQQAGRDHPFRHDPGIGLG